MKRSNLSQKTVRFLDSAPAQVGLLRKGKSFVARNHFRIMLATMDWQQLVALTIVVVTAALLVASKFRRRKFSFERDTHCGCGAGRNDTPQHSVIFHARKGERPQVLIKMK